MDGDEVIRRLVRRVVEVAADGLDEHSPSRAFSNVPPVGPVFDRATFAGVPVPPPLPPIEEDRP